MIVDKIKGLIDLIQDLEKRIDLNCLLISKQRNDIEDIKTKLGTHSLLISNHREDIEKLNKRQFEFDSRILLVERNRWIS